MLSLKRTPAVPFLATGACAPRVPPGRSDGSERLPEEKARAERVGYENVGESRFPLLCPGFFVRDGKPGGGYSPAYRGLLE